MAAAACVIILYQSEDTISSATVRCAEKTLEGLHQHIAPSSFDAAPWIAVVAASATCGSEFIASCPAQSGGVRHATASEAEDTAGTSSSSSSLRRFTVSHSSAYLSQQVSDFFGKRSSSSTAGGNSRNDVDDDQSSTSSGILCSMGAALARCSGFMRRAARASLATSSGRKRSRIINTPTTAGYSTSAPLTDQEQFSSSAAPPPPRVVVVVVDPAVLLQSSKRDRGVASFGTSSNSSVAFAGDVALSSSLLALVKHHDAVIYVGVAVDEDASADAVEELRQRLQSNKVCDAVGRRLAGMAAASGGTCWVPFTPHALLAQLWQQQRRSPTQSVMDGLLSPWERRRQRIEQSYIISPFGLHHDPRTPIAIAIAIAAVKQEETGSNTGDDQSTSTKNMDHNGSGGHHHHPCCFFLCARCGVLVCTSSLPCEDMTISVCPLCDPKTV